MAKRDTRLDAIKYQEMLKAQQAKKRATEEQAKEEIDKLSRLVAALRQMGAQVGEAESELDRASAALKEKDWTRAYNGAGAGLAAAEKGAANAARAQVDGFLRTVREVERSGAPTDELAPLQQEARSLLEQSRYLDAFRKGQEGRARALEAGRISMEQAMGELMGLLEDDRKRGVNTSAPDALLSKARQLMAGGDVNFEQLSALIVVEGYAAREAALRGDISVAAQEGPSPQPADAEDQDAVKRAVEENFRRADEEIATARGLKANVAAADKEISKAKSAFDAGDFKAARVGASRAVVAGKVAARKAVLGLLEDALADVRRLRLAGVNVTEPRKNLATAKARVAEGGFREAFSILDDIVKKAAAMREDQQKLVREVDQTYDGLLKLTDTLLVPIDAVEALEEARNFARRGDVERAQSSLKRAQTAGREFWSAVINDFVKDTRAGVIESQRMGGQIVKTRGNFNLAKQMLDEGKFQDALNKTLETTRTLQGTSPAYLEALNLAASVSLHLKIAQKLGVLDPAHQKALEDSETLRASFDKDGEAKAPEVLEADLARHRESLEAIKYDFKGEQERFQRLMRRTLELENEVEEGKKIGTDMTKAEELLFNARDQLTKRRFAQSDELLKEIEADITQLKDARIDELLRDADTDLKHLRAGGVYVDDVDREVREARAQHANRNYEVAVDLIQDAISTALERQQDLDAARREVARAESLIEQGGAYAADVSAGAALLDEAKLLAREHDDRDALALAQQATGELQVSLAKYIDLILEETEKQIGHAEAEHGEFPEARARLNEARRLKERGEVGEALVTARDIASGLQQSLEMINEIRQRIALVESGIAWTSQYSKTVVMPHKLLEHAKERLEARSLEAAREAATEAQQKTEEAQRQLIRGLHREAFELIDDLEEKGVQLTAARNLMMQAQGLLETKGFQESYKSAVQAQDVARKAFEIFQRTQRSVGELEEEVQALTAFGIDAAPLTALLEKASGAFAEEDYDGANESIVEAQKLAPSLKAARADELEASLGGRIEAGKAKRGLNLKKFREAFEHCKATRKEGDLNLALEMLQETSRDLEGALKESDGVEALLASIEERRAEFESIGLETRALETARQTGLKRLDAMDLKEGASLLKRALKTAEKDGSAAAAARIDAVIQEALALRLKGYPSEGVIKAAEAGSGALLKGAFSAAVKAAAEGAEELKGIVPRTDVVRRDLSRARHAARLLKDGFGGEAQDVAFIDGVERTLAHGDLPGAEAEAGPLLTGVLEALGEVVRARADAVEAALQKAEEGGASTRSVAEALRMARTALEEGIPEAAAHWSRVGEAQVVRAVTEAREAEGALERAALALEDVRAFEASTQALEPKVDEMRALLEARRHRQVLLAGSEVEKLAQESKKARVDGRKTEVVAFLQRAAKLGMPQERARKALQAAEGLLGERRFEDSLRALDALEAEVGEALKRHDEIAEGFEAVADLLESFADLKADFKAVTDTRDHARAAIDKFDLKEADELTELFGKELDSILSSHVASRSQALERAALAAKAEGVVVADLDNHRRVAEDELHSRRFREALVAIDRGLETHADAKKRHGEVARVLAEAEATVKQASALGLDFSEALASLSAARAKMGEGAYEEAKVDADYAASAARAKRADEVERRVEDLTTQIEEAASVGVSIEADRAGLKKARDAAEALDFPKLIDAEKAIQASLARKLQERSAALEGAERLQGLIGQLGELEMPTKEFAAEADAAAKLLAGNDFKRAHPAHEALSKKVMDRMKAKVDASLAEIQAVLRTCQKSAIDVGPAQQELDGARSLLQRADFVAAFVASRSAERLAYENKDKRDRAAQVLRFLKDNLELAPAFGVDTTNVDTLHMQARDAFEFQSWEEAAGTGLEALGKVQSLLAEAFEGRRRESEARAEELELGGANVGILRKELDLAAGLAEGHDFISADISLAGTRKRIDRLASEFAGAKESQEAFARLIDVADLLAVDAKEARSALDAAQDLSDAGKYVEASRAFASGRAALSRVCAGEVQKRLDGAGVVLEQVEAAGVPTEALTALLDRAATELVDEDYSAAFSTAREVMEEADRKRRTFEAAREAVRAARRRLKVAEELEADAASGREMLSEAEILFRDGDFDGSVGAASQSIQVLSAAAVESAGLAITEAEQNLREFGASGVKCPPAQDSLERSRQALELEDALGSVRFARLALRAAEGARREMGEAEKVLGQAEDALARAGALVDVSEAERGALAGARREFEAGQMRRAVAIALEARAGVEGRARLAFEGARAEILAIMGALAKLKGDPGPTGNELKEAEKAFGEGRSVEALEGAVATRAFAREMLMETSQARAAESEALLDQAEAAGVDASLARGHLDALKRAAQDGEAQGAVEASGKLKETLDGALKAKADQVALMVQKASEHRLMKAGTGAKEAASFRAQAGELRAQVSKGDWAKVLPTLASTLEKVEGSLANVVAERLVEIDSIRDAHGGKREAPAEESGLYDAVTAAADRGRATLADLDSADKLDQSLRDLSSKFVADSTNRIKREIMAFEDKAAVARLSAMLAAVEKVRGNAASAVARTYELLESAKGLMAARAEAMLKQADRQVELVRAVEADAAATQDFADRAHAAFAEGRVAEAIEFAESAVKEGQRLQEAQVLEVLKKVKTEFEAAPEGPAKVEAKRLIAEALQARQSRDVEAAYDFTRKAREALLEEAREKAEAEIGALLELVGALEAEGLDSAALRDAVEDVRQTFEAWDAITARKKLAEAGALIRKQHGDFQAVSGALVKMEEGLARTQAAKIDTGDLGAKLEAGRRLLKEGDYAGARKAADAVGVKLNELRGAKAKVLIASAQAKNKHNRNLEIDNPQADELVATALKLLAAKDTEGALDAATRAIAEADGAKEVAKQVRALGERGTELLERAAEAGVSLSPEQEKIIFDAAKGRLKAGMKPSALEELIESIGEQIGIGGPRLEFSFAVGEPPVVNRTNNAVLEIANRGDGAASDLAITFAGDASVKLLGRPPASIEPGERADLEIQVITRKMGDIGLRLLVTYKDALTGETKRRTERRWVTFFDPTDTAVADQFQRREEKCLVCVGAIPPTERLKVCECQSTFHLHCAAGLKECPKCGRSLADS